MVSNAFGIAKICVYSRPSALLLQFIPVTLSLHESKSRMGGMLDLHLAPNLPAGLCHTKPNILRCQPVSSSAPTQRHKCIFKYQEAQRCSCTPAHLWNIFPHFWCSCFLDCCCLNVDWPLSVHFEKQKYKPKLSSIFCCQSESALQKDSKFQDFHLWGKVKLLKL